MKLEESTALQRDWNSNKEPQEMEACAVAAEGLGALLEHAGAPDDDPERRVAALGVQLARLDALNVAGMLGAATEGGGAALAARLDAALGASAALSARRARAADPARGATDAVHARSGAARADASARALLQELSELFAWLEPPALRDLDSLSELPLASADGRARALAACEALRGAARAEGCAAPHLRRLGGVRERLRRLARARDAVTAAVARHVNNLLIHHGNEAAAAATGGAPDAARQRHDLLPLAPFMLALKDMDEKAFDGLAKVYMAGRGRAVEREVRAACEAARAALAPPAPADKADALLDGVLALVETLCNAEQDFCSQFFFLDADVKDGGRAESRRFLAALFSAVEPALATLTHHIEKQDSYGAFRVMACVGRRVVVVFPRVSDGSDGWEGRWARAALAGAAVAAKRQADRAVAERAAALPDHVRGAAKRTKCGVLGFVAEFEQWAAACERMFAGGRRADLERWYGSLAGAMVSCVRHAEHPRTPRAVVLLENYHALHAALSALRVPALEAARRECRARYEEALRTYVTQYFGRPLEKLQLFFDGVSEAVAGGCREDEVCYRAAFSKHSLRRVLALYPAAEVRRALHRLYRTVEKHLSEDGGLLQVVWRAMQEEFMAQHRALEARIAACYPAAGLALPLTTQHILDAFSDIAREH